VGTAVAFAPGSVGTAVGTAAPEIVGTAVGEGGVGVRVGSIGRVGIEVAVAARVVSVGRRVGVAVAVTPPLLEVSHGWATATTPATTATTTAAAIVMSLGVGRQGRGVSMSGAGGVCGVPGRGIGSGPVGSGLAGRTGSGGTGGPASTAGRVGATGITGGTTLYRLADFAGIWW